METINITTTSSDFTIVRNGQTLGTWDKEDELDSEWKVTSDPEAVRIELPGAKLIIVDDTEVIVDGVSKSSLSMKQLFTFLKDNVFFTASAGGGLSYKVYTALLSHPGGAVAPNAAVLGTPTINDVTFGYDGEGDYYIGSPDFVEGKTWFMFQPNATGWSGNIYEVQAGMFFNELGYPPKAISFRTLDYSKMETNNWNGGNIPIEIRVYPD